MNNQIRIRFSLQIIVAINGDEAFPVEGGTKCYDAARGTIEKRGYAYSLAKKSAFRNSDSKRCI